ncbi:hypothetical protein AS96_12820 [Microbacterium sp. MRS-1]|uniref:FtsK domain-containing protein n=1 Tax=Candidatus Microsaccharimonas sossegonensis TaxID=2506948 RepID=A0A4Q0AH68_9BACT|nr:FtsK/SpoIIIE domain-containing protein [Microbacterium sp. MRS-1]EXJ50793.1 hypothetical protein AS96_12820 [Microbacterium sp. MRS-1]RWZ78515.1 MAG: hypothetical protein EOT05_02060 [Candidatus Microsaccharimonas sossegonensis]
MIDDEVARLASDVVTQANRAAGLLEAHKASAAKNAAIARSQAAKVREAANTELLQSLRNTLGRAREAALGNVTALAPGALGARWDEVEALRQDVDVLGAAEYVRCGSLLLRQQGASPTEVPLILPFLDQGNIRIVAGSDRRDAVTGAVQEIVLRSLLGTGAGQLSLLTFDPKLSASLALFTPLRQASEEVVKQALSTADELRVLLEGLTRDVRRISDMYGGAPTTLGEFRRSTGQPIEHYQVVTVLDYPTGFDERLNTLLLTLMRTGPNCGISFIVHHDQSAPIPDGVDVAALTSLATSVDLNAAAFPLAEGYQVRAGSAPSSAIVEPALAKLTTSIRKAAAPRIDFLDLQPDPHAYWSERSADRITATIGRIGHHPIQITLGDEVEQKHNVLVTGAVGQGKSNLLMALIHSWAMNYSPEELELYLLDFKDGVSLYPLAAHGTNADWLPHAKVLGLESDRPFGLAVLEHLVGEFERRSRIIKPYGDNIARYRAEQPHGTMPRIVAVIDEFQVLFEEDDDTTSAAVLALERLAKRGRAYGIHLVLASQTLSGITALLAKQDGIFGQFPIRLALHNSAAESRVALSQNNTEAARLRYRGELIVNKDFGEVDANQRGVVAFADPDKLREARSVLVKRTHGGPIPAVFNGAVPANLAEHLVHDNTTEAPTALLGVGIDVNARVYSVPFDDASGRHLSILGTGKRVDGSVGNPAADALQAAAASLAWSTPSGTARFIILNLLAPSDPSQQIVQDLHELVEQLGHESRVVNAKEVIAELAHLEEEVASRRGSSPDTKIYVIGFGLDRLQQARVLNFETGTTPVDGLIAVWKDGAPLGVHLLGWWSNVRIYNDHVGFDAQGLIDTIMVFKIPTDAAIDVFGPFFTWHSPDNRAAVRDVAQETTPDVVVPFSDTSTGALSALMDAQGR